MSVLIRIYMDLRTRRSEGEIRTFGPPGPRSKGDCMDESDQHQQGQDGDSEDKTTPTFGARAPGGARVVVARGFKFNVLFSRQDGSFRNSVQSARHLRLETETTHWPSLAGIGHDRGRPRHLRIGNSFLQRKHEARCHDWNDNRARPTRHVHKLTSITQRSLRHWERRLTAREIGEV